MSPLVYILCMPAHHVTVLIALFSTVGFASVFLPVATVDKPPVKLELPYTLGTHEGKISSISGSVNIEMGALEKSVGNFQAKIDDIFMDGSSISCHMRESIGLDYSVSDFPESHVCDSNQLPATGPNSVKFPTVSWIWSGASLRDGVVIAKGEWQIHGVRQPSELALRWEQIKPDLIRLHGTTTLSLQAFGIVVKPAFFISAKDELKVILDVLLSKDHQKK
jgi:hypothetical protein